MCADAPTQPSGLRLWAPLVAVSLAMFIVVVDSTMMNVAVPTIVRDLETNVSSVQGTIALYSLVMAALMLTGGKIGAIYGVKRMFTLGIVIYGVGTLLAAFSWNIYALAFGWSLLEGIGAALVMPLAFTLIAANYDGRQRALCFGVLAGVQASAAAVGPILGGVLTTYLSWRWGFGGEVIIALLIFPLLPFVRELTSRERTVELDWWGTIFSTAGMLLIVLGFLAAGRYGWWSSRRTFELFDTRIHLFGLSPTPILIAIGLALIVVFVHWQIHRESIGKSPLVRMRVLTNTRFMAGATTYIMRSAFLSGLLFVLPLYMQSALEFTAFQSGLAILPFSLATFVVSLTTASWNERLSAKFLIQLGLVLLAIGILTCYWSIDVDMTISSFLLPTSLLGIGLGLVMAQLVNLTLSYVQPDDTAEASGVNNAFGELGNSFGTAVIGSLLLSFFLHGLVNDILRTGRLELAPGERQQLILRLEDADDIETEAGQSGLVDALPESVREDLPNIFDDHAVLAMKETLVVVLLLILLTLLASTFLPQQIRSKQDDNQSGGS